MELEQTVPDLTVRIDDGTETTLSELADGNHLVVFFYPKAFTSGCTAQACHFRDLHAEFAAAGVNVVGVSRDAIDVQARFRRENGFNYPLITDPDGVVSKAFQAKRLGPLPSKRQTVTLTPELRILHVTKSETDMNAHADEALASVQSATGPAGTDDAAS